MRYLIIVIFLILVKDVFSQSGKPGLDTVFCDTKNTSYVVFNDDVTLIDVGNPDDYAAQVKGNIVFVKPLKENVHPTTVLIKTVKEIYYGTLMYKIKAKKYYYDMTGKNGGEGSPPVVKESSPTEKTEQAKTITQDQKNETISSTIITADPQLRDKMVEFVKIKSELNTLGFISPNVDAAVTVIRNDNNNTFLKIVLKNKSSIPFKLDFISFQYYQDMKKGAFRKSKKAPIDVFPVGGPTIKEIAPGKGEALPYVIPSYALANNGYLMVLVRESSGDRVLKIKIDGSVIQDSPQLVSSNGK